MAMATTAVFLLMNGHILLPSSEEMVRFALEVAESEPDMPWQDVAQWVRRNTVRLTRERDPLEQVREKYENWED